MKKIFAVCVSICVLAMSGVSIAQIKPILEGPRQPNVKRRGPDISTQRSKGGNVEVENTLLFQQAKKANIERYNFAVEHNASFYSTPDGKSFYIVWMPETAVKGGTVPMVVSLHGHGSYAFDELFLWQKHLAKRGYGIIALQWWFGAGEKPDDYYKPNELYKNIDQILHKMNAKSETAMLHGFSRGSANSYGVTAFDRASKNNFFLVTLANAGKPGSDFPVNVEIEKGRFGANPLAGTHWITYAGANDPDPGRDGIEGMRKAREWIKRFGGTVDLSIEDAKGDHGGFHRNPENISAALDVFEKLLSGSEKK